MYKASATYDRTVNYLFLNFSSTVKELFNYLKKNPELELDFTIRQVVFEDSVSATGVISCQEFDKLYSIQKELFMAILGHLKHNAEIHSQYELLSGLMSEYKILKHLLSDNPSEVLKEFIGFIDADLVPIVNIHLDRIDEVLKIKNHKSYVRKRMTDNNVIRIGGCDQHVIEDVLEFLQLKCSNEEGYYALKQEIVDGRRSDSDYYLLKDVTFNTLAKFFKILYLNQGLPITRNALAEWLSNRFRYEKNGEHIPFNSESTFREKLKGKLTPKEMATRLSGTFI